MSLNNIQVSNFQNRLKVSDDQTEMLMNILLDEGHFSFFRKASTEEDRSGIDWWVVYPGETEEQPIQFKLRVKQKDLPICRYQPFYGVDHPKTVEGRDWRGIRDRKSTQYYVGVCSKAGHYTEIYKVPCDILRSIMIDLDQEWRAVEGRFENYAPQLFTEEIFNIWIEKSVRDRKVFTSENGCQIWWKKNFNEPYAKFNMYIPYEFNDWSMSLNKQLNT